MRTRVCHALVLASAFAAVVHGEPAAAQSNAALVWNEATLQSIRNVRFAPMLAARALAITHTCMYDAWAAYHEHADGAHWIESLRQPAADRTAANRAEAVSFAAHTALADLFPSQAANHDAVLASLGYSSPGTSGAIGIRACNMVLNIRRHDGSNQLGDVNGGAPYSDYTGYMPANSADALNDPNRWQPLATPAGPQQFLTPHWGRVLPFALSDLDASRPEPPPQHPHGSYGSEANQILHFSATLDDTRKMIAEYWADGPATETPPGHWFLFAQAVSRRDGHSLDEDVKLFFALGNAELDASIAAWDCKVAFDFARPVTVLRYLYGGKPVRAWNGPGLGTALIDGSSFRSYIATPPFAEYVSGHSTFSSASAEILRSFTGSDAFEGSVTLAAGSSTIEPGLTPARAVTLSWTSFSEAADQAGLSRRYGGIHFESGDLAGRALGRRVGAVVWTKAVALFTGTAAAQW